MGGIITNLTGKWNCQILNNGLSCLFSAYIIHYFSSGIFKNNTQQPYFFMNDDLFLQIKNDGQISHEVIEKIINAKEAFTEIIEIYSGDDIVLLHSVIFKNIKRFFYKRPNMFRSMESFLKKLSVVKNIFLF